MIRRRALLGVFCFRGHPLRYGGVRQEGVRRRRQFSRQIPKDARIQQALNRLTFGARPGDAETVRKLGLKNWLDRQLHPERIAESPVLEDKLKYLDSLKMSSHGAGS